MVAISNYFATLGVKVDNKSLKDVDNFLAKIEKKLSSGTGKRGMSIVPKVDVAAFEKHLRQVLRGIGGKNSSALRVKVQVSEQGIRKSLTHIISNKAFNAPVTPVMSNRSLSALRTQLQQALMGVGVNIRLGNVTQRGGRGSQGGGYNWSPNSSGGPNRANSRAPTTPHLAEWLGGKPDRSSLSAANRRYSDSIMKEGLLGGVPQGTLSGLLSESLLGGLGRVGSSTMAGRGLGALGSSLGGARGGAVGLIAGSVIPAVTGAFKGIWGGLATVVTAPFKLIGGAANAVTSGFYRLALALAPIVAGFTVINRNVQETATKNIALEATASNFGSSAKTEKEWLYKTAMTEGVNYNDMIMPYASFMNAYAPKQGIAGTRDMFQAFSQYGRVHGANKESSKNAFYALSQMASKGNITSEELNQQLAEAQGYSGAKNLVAQAYQISLGKSVEEAKANKEATNELTAAMKKGAVKADKIFPILAELMREASKSGVDLARTSSASEQERFNNQITKGWENFSAGGGEEGLAYFWRMMQQMGSWWESNGAKLGDYFRILMVDLNTLRVGLMEFAQFAWTGKEGDLTNLLQNSLGIDVVTLRENIIKIGTQISDLFERLAIALGFKKEGSYLKGVADKLGVFVENLSRIFVHIDAMLSAVERFMTAWNNFSALPIQTKIGSILPGTAGNKELSNLINSAGSFAYHGIAATVGAGKTQIDAAAGGGVPSRPAPILPQTPYKNPNAWGDNSVPPAISVPMSSRPSETISRHDVNIKVSSDTDSPEAVAKITQVAQNVFQSKLVGSIVNATVV